MPTLNLGPTCRRCRTSEAGCARVDGCCVACTHNFGHTSVKQCAYRNVTVAQISGGVAPYVAVCDDCGRITSQQRLISVVLAELVRMHGRQPRIEPRRRAA